MMNEDRVVMAARNHISRNCRQKQRPNLIANKCHLENRYFWVGDSQEGLYQQPEQIVTSWN